MTKRLPGSERTREALNGLVEGRLQVEDAVDLNSLKLTVRPRSHWEATDLGCLMARRWVRLVYGGWCVTALPLIALAFLLLGTMPTLAVLLVWWLKPLYERLPLWLLSQAIFGEEPRARDALTAWREVFLPQLAQALTVRRFSPTRSFDAPVQVLEGLAGTRRRDRLQILQRSAGSQAFWLTVLGVHLEAFISWSVLVIVVVLVPSEVDVDFWAMLTGPESSGVNWLLNLSYVLAMALVGPVYVAGGFALYLNRRIELEGWDIELAFKRLAERVAGLALPIALPIAMVVVLAASTPSPALADSVAEESRALIEEGDPGAGAGGVAG